MTRHSKEMKHKILQRMMPPNNESVSQIARDSGLSETTLYKWKKAARAQGIAMPSGEKETERWSARDKFLGIYFSKSSTFLAPDCGRNGIFAPNVRSSAAAERRKVNRNKAWNDRFCVIPNSEHQANSHSLQAIVVPYS